MIWFKVRSNQPIYLIIGDKSSKKPKDEKLSRAYYDSFDELVFFKKNLDKIVKIQAIWRGKVARNKFETLQLTVNNNSKHLNFNTS